MMARSFVWFSFYTWVTATGARVQNAGLWPAPGLLHLGVEDCAGGTRSIATPAGEHAYRSTERSGLR